MIKKWETDLYTTPVLGGTLTLNFTHHSPLALNCQTELKVYKNQSPPKKEKNAKEPPK